ncbi:hypothetical protein DFR70_10987 [Nocardia tenerifensis]|uniref:DUF6286 domain-containing protein n=1 Tax=Nocardia tenerifensis TaxID=228006 RepID=A0A318K0J0_9NOCA|nr:DUF6286 domain-containing protein [Nocardia tenerifensis]PXX60896.1 hypothetical protein DFR70_10987 [Nocardia tenerifensis]
MIRRPRRVLPAIVVAVLLLAVCVAVAVSLIQRLVGAHEFLSYDTVASDLHGMTWHDMPVLVAGVATAVLGLVLLALALWPGRAAVLPLGDEDGLTAGVTRGGLRTALRSTADTVDGVSSARIRLRRNAVKVSAHTDRSGADSLPDEICQTLTRRVQEIGPQPVRRVRAKLHGPKEAKAHGPKTAKQYGTESAERHRRESAERHGPKSAEPHGPQTAEPHGPESSESRGSRSGEPHGPESAVPHGSRSGEPHGPESSEPRGSRSAEPHGPESAGQHGPVAAEPHGPEAAESHWSKSAERHRSQTAGPETGEA